MFFASVVVAALAGFAQAQTVSVQAVQVASNNGSLTFSPDRITAAEGSMVQFQFMGGNHTVTQSTFDQPCVPLNVANPAATQAGIFSGYVPVAASANQGQRPVFTIMVNSTAPMWLYCQQGPHCQRGMAMVINENPTANASRTLENYKAAAAALGGGAGGGNGGNTGGNGDAPATPGAAPGQNGGNGVPAAGSLLAIPSTLLLLAGTAVLLL
ncbi:Cupredoxin [Plectosphaerella cucumerina]|uniref:Cupredoxin n=1 Tax=Plectosphaerella cucumerina TaxID=40658 RepID=A0A8K0TPY6_9PEZI|nr:Cupredoxin [Plectosphaerella cucumerina]